MRRFWQRFFANRGGAVGLAMMLLVVAVAAGAPWLFPGDPLDAVARPLLPPFEDARYLLGTDRSGRDIAAGIAHGARVSLMIGILASLGATLFGLIVGAIAGYYGRAVDTILMRCTDFFLTIPSFILAIVIIAIFRPSVATVTLAIAAVSWPQVARLARAEFIAHRDREYVLACRALGMSDFEIITRQILPNALPSLLVVSSLLVATSILTESGLSFLGLSDPNVISWGYMVGVGRTVLRVAWWMPAIPGIAILLTVLCINLVGEGLNEALNPRLQRR